jgi:hypothetical protein
MGDIKKIVSCYDCVGKLLSVAACLVAMQTVRWSCGEGDDVMDGVPTHGRPPAHVISVSISLESSMIMLRTYISIRGPQVS